MKILSVILFLFLIPTLCAKPPGSAKDHDRKRENSQGRNPHNHESRPHKKIKPTVPKEGSLWRFKSNMKSSSSVVIRAIVGKGWGNGPQHTKSTHSWFANLPGIKVGIPSNAFDAKGMLIESVFSDNPTIIFEHRSLFNLKELVPKEPYRISFGKCAIRKKGKDITVVCIGYGIIDMLKAYNKLKENDIYPEIIDVRSLYPLDIKTIINSVKKTKRLLVIDPSWKSFGSSSEIISLVVEKIHKLKSLPRKITHPDSHTPVSIKLENNYYFNSKDIINTIEDMVR